MSVDIAVDISVYSSDLYLRDSIESLICQTFLMDSKLRNSITVFRDSDTGRKPFNIVI